jgi:hypothetical protein
MRKFLDAFELTTDMQEAVKNALQNGTGILRINDDGSVVHIPYESILKAANEVNNKDGT